MLLYYRFFHPRGSGAIQLFIKKAKQEDQHRLHQDGPREMKRRSDIAEISRRSRSPTPRNSPDKGAMAPLVYPVTTRSLTPNKYSPLKSDELPYDRYGMRRGQRSMSEACIDDSTHHYIMTTPTQRMGRFHSEQMQTVRRRSSEKKARASPSQSEHLYYSPARSVKSRKSLEYSGFATDLVKQFDSKLNRACATAMSSYSYNSYGFDVEAQHQRSLNSEHSVMVHASASQPDMRRRSPARDDNRGRSPARDDNRDQSSVLLEPLLESAKSRGGGGIKNAYEVRQMYHDLHGEAKPKRSSKRQLMFGQSSSAAIKNRQQTPMCLHHNKMSLQRSFSLPPASKTLTWQESEIKASSEPKSQNIRRTPPKIPPRAGITVATAADTMRNNEVQQQQQQNKLKIPHDTSKAERAMLKLGEKRKFSFKEKIPAASLKAMRFTPKVNNVEPGSPVWKLHELNNRLWQPKSVDIYNPKLNQSPGRSKVVAQQPSSYQKLSFGRLDSPNEFSNFYTIFEPTKQNDQPSTNTSANPVTSTKLTPHNNTTSTQSNAMSERSITSRTSFPFSVGSTSTTTKSFSSLKNNSSGNKSENIYASIDENGVSSHTYTELGDLIYFPGRNQSNPYETSGSSNGSGGSGSGSGGKKRKLSPRSDLPQQELKPSLQSAHPVTPLTPSKSYRLADSHMLNSPHRHIISSSSSSSERRSKSRLEFAAMHSQSHTSIDSEILANPFILDASRTGVKNETVSNEKSRTLESNPRLSPAETSSASGGILKSSLKKSSCSDGKKITQQKQSETKQNKLKSEERKSETKQQRSEMKPRSEPKQKRDGTTEKVSNPKSAETVKYQEHKSSSDSKVIKIKSQLEILSAISSSLPVITDSLQSRNTEALNPCIVEIISDQNLQEENSHEQSPDISETQPAKSQSLPVIPGSNDTSRMKKEVKPKAQSDTRGNCKQPQQTTAVFRKPLGEIQNGSTTSASISNVNIRRMKKVSSSGRIEELMRLANKPDDNDASRLSKRLSTSIESLMPLMQSTPALPDCRKLLRFESTGAKPKIRQLHIGEEIRIPSGMKSKTMKKPLSPVENNPDDIPAFPPIIAGSIKSRNDINIRANPMASLTRVPTTLTRVPTLERSLREKLGRDKLARLDLDLLRSGKENQHFPVTRWYDIMSPTDSFISSLAFQNTYNIEKRVVVPERRAPPPQKPPRMSIQKIPPNKVANNIAKFSNGTDL